MAPASLPEERRRREAKKRRRSTCGSADNSALASQGKAQAGRARSSASAASRRSVAAKLEGSGHDPAAPIAAAATLENSGRKASRDRTAAALGDLVAFEASALRVAANSASARSSSIVFRFRNRRSARAPSTGSVLNFFRLGGSRGPRERFSSARFSCVRLPGVACAVAVFRKSRPILCGHLGGPNGTTVAPEIQEVLRRGQGGECRQPYQPQVSAPSLSPKSQPQVWS